jgi:hypothetical protein
MKITVSTSQQSLTDRIVGEFQNAGAQVGVRKLGRKLDLLAPIDWVGFADAEGWVYSSLVDIEKQTVLLIAETKEPIPTDTIRDVGVMLKHMNSKSDYGRFAFDDREGTVLYLAGPFIYDRAGFVLRHELEAMNSAICEISLGLERAATSVSAGRARHMLRRETYRVAARPVLIP